MENPLLKQDVEECDTTNKRSIMEKMKDEMETWQAKVIVIVCTGLIGFLIVMVYQIGRLTERLDKMQPCEEFCEFHAYNINLKYNITQQTIAFALKELINLND